MLEEVRRVISKYKTKCTFMRRVSLHFGYDSQEYCWLKTAYELAREQFHGVSRLSGEPYFYHKLAVAVILMEYLHVRDANLIAAAFVHDLLEDIEGWNESSLAAKLGNDVAKLVEAVTKPPKTAQYHSNHQYEKAVFAKVRAGGLRAIKLKLADRLHNLLTLWGEPEKCVAKVHETVRYIVPLAEEFDILWKELVIACGNELTLHRDLFVQKAS